MVAYFQRQHHQRLKRVNVSGERVRESAFEMPQAHQSPADEHLGRNETNAIPLSP
jgi:hypothetical protein